MNGTLLSDAMRSEEHMTDPCTLTLKDDGFVRFAGRIKFTRAELNQLPLMAEIWKA